MKTVEFKTNIMCGACIAKVTPVMNETFGEGNWTVDTKDAEKKLTVQSEDFNSDQFVSDLNKVGYRAERLN